jgi:hypothetical protein
MAASSKDKRMPIATPPYQVPSVDATPDQPIFSLATTFKPILHTLMVRSWYYGEKLLSGHQTQIFSFHLKCGKKQYKQF